VHFETESNTKYKLHAMYFKYVFQIIAIISQLWSRIVAFCQLRNMSVLKICSSAAAAAADDDDDAISSWILSYIFEYSTKLAIIGLSIMCHSEKSIKRAATAN